jgi:hypothetical protein
MAGTLLEEEGFETEPLFSASPYIVQGTVHWTGLDKNRFFAFFLAGWNVFDFPLPLTPIYDF